MPTLLKPKPLFLFYVWLSQRISFGGVLILLSLPLIPLVNLYAYFFLHGIVPGDLKQIYHPESLVFPYAFTGALSLFFVLGGALHRLGIPSVLPAVRRLEPSVRGFTKSYSKDELRSILGSLSNIPNQLTYLLIGIFLLQNSIVFGYGFYTRGNVTDIKLFYIVFIVALIMLSGLINAITDFMCAFMRIRVKRSLGILGESINDEAHAKSETSSLFFIFFVGSVSTISLITFLYFNHDSTFWPAIGVGTILFIICAVLIAIYIYTFRFSLNQISDAMRDVAMGGRGLLPLFSNGRELTQLAINFDTATQEIHSIRNYLNDLVDEKTQKITDAFNELKHLKSRQDGDYFLTANLIDSLIEIRPESETVLVEALAKQFKTFEFMEHTREIGGDMNSAYALHLGDEKYTLVVNADAMGKSLQGAGGVLVLGTALRSLLERTYITEELRKLSPERWLKNAFLELHRLFASFNGSMMVSMVCLLVHDRSGYTVMINAEHPRGILLRAGHSEYISGHDGLRKLGNTAVKGRLWVDTFMFQEGDVIILGSDGRDDVIVGYDEHKQPVINQDDDNFLTIVRMEAGDLTRIYQRLKKTSEIVDDISLVRVEYQSLTIQHNNEAVSAQWHEYHRTVKSTEKLIILREILHLDPNDTKAWRALLYLHLKAENLIDAASVSETLVQLTPQRDTLLFVAALLSYRIGDYAKALHYADRLTLRNWHNENYLVLLGKIYEAKQDTKGMREAGMLLVELEPLHEYGKKLLEMAR
ncbi:MAG TPA: SpoIIE family protein phosphatase [Turneriella sp.]|nr:SpoIIE family protein phosphatase [Turneriella sp.]